MGTRGYVVLRIAGRYYAFYNHWDSYPGCLGAEVVENIVALIRRFGGDIGSLCRVMRTNISKMDVAEEAEVSWNTEDVLANILRAVPGDKLRATDLRPVSPDVCIEYVWTINFDNASLGLTCNKRHGAIEWRMKHLYRLPDIDPWWPAANEWVYAEKHQTRAYLGVEGVYDGYSSEDEGNNDSDGEDSVGEKDEKMLLYRRTLYASIIQCWWRRLCVFRQALEPDTGLLFQIARRRFENAQAL